MGATTWPAWSPNRWWRTTSCSVQALSSELVELMPEYWRGPSAFGPWIYVLYLAHRRITRKVKRFIEHLKGRLEKRK